MTIEDTLKEDLQAVDVPGTHDEIRSVASDRTRWRHYSLTLPKCSKGKIRNCV